MLVVDILKKYDVYAFTRSEILDECTCNICLSIDGRVFHVDDEILKIDHFCNHCRGTWVGILKNEVRPPKIEGMPEELRQLIAIAKGEGRDLNKPIVKEGGVAESFLLKRQQ